MTDGQRERFDSLVEEVIAALPPALKKLLDEVPVIVEDTPGEDILEEMGEEDETGLLGLHSGVPFTEQSVESSGELPPDIRLFREGIVAGAGGWQGADADPRIAEEIRVTLLHEIGHQFGLDEDDLEELGYQ